jgi:2-dehydro-3-deoxyphosphogluconate aldolase/(4S)-4-hydroxy-2-oxoglutarate aldolase
MNKKESIQQLVIEQGILPLYYHDSSEISIAVLKALFDAGIRAVEYTNRGENALGNFKLLIEAIDNNMPGMQLGIGTIKTTAAAKAFIEAGAGFIICPLIDPAVGEVAHKAGLAWIPGCMTTTEIHSAEVNGATLVKIFPGSVVGPGYISAIREIFPNLAFMPTGGVDTTAENLSAWFNNGVCAVGLGSKLITKKGMEEKNFGELTRATATILQLVKSIKDQQR